MPLVDVRISSLEIDSAETSRLEQHLAPDERLRAGRFRFERDRRRFVARRGLLREWLAELLHERPEELAFITAQWGKPALRDHRCCFNLSHSADLLLVAISDREIGCDIERIDDRLNWPSIAEQVLNPHEVEELLNLAPAQASAAFFRLWVRMEAFLKASGHGLPGLDTCKFEVDGGGSRPWHLTDLDVDPGYAAAIATTTDSTPLRLTVRRF